MNTVREAAATKSGNPLCDKSHVELTLRVMPPATETGWLKVPHQGNEVRHEHGARSGGAGNAAWHLLPQSAGYASNVSEVPA
jgi:hypothetical protein